MAKQYGFTRELLGNEYGQLLADLARNGSFIALVAREGERPNEEMLDFSASANDFLVRVETGACSWPCIERADPLGIIYWYRLDADMAACLARHAPGQFNGAGDPIAKFFEDPFVVRRETPQYVLNDVVYSACSRLRCCSIDAGALSAKFESQLLIDGTLIEEKGV